MLLFRSFRAKSFLAIIRLDLAILDLAIIRFDNPILATRYRKLLEIYLSTQFCSSYLILPTCADSIYAEFTALNFSNSMRYNDEWAAFKRFNALLCRFWTCRTIICHGKTFCYSVCYPSCACYTSAATDSSRYPKRWPNLTWTKSEFFRRICLIFCSGSLCCWSFVLRYFLSCSLLQ